MEIEFRCQDCKTVNQQEDVESGIVCSSCGKSYGEVFDKRESDQRVPFCVICRCRDLYVQKDFNRKLGVAIVVLGAILAPFTKLMSLLVCAFIDLVLYLALPVITICYKCHTIYRGFEKNPNHEGFNLGINDRYRAAER
jgi:hypothetical protein